MNNLRSGWCKTSMGDLGILFCGQSPTPADVNRLNKGTPYVTGPEQWDGNGIRADKWTTDPRRIVPDGCIFITVKGAGVGKTFPGIACAIGRDVYAFKPYEELSRAFVHYALDFEISDLVKQSSGLIPGLSKDPIINHPIGLPPLAEQHRIVAKIEELFSDLDAGIASLKKAKEQLKTYRQAVLKWAFEGKLTEDWRKLNSDSIPESESRKGALPNGWASGTLGQFLSNIEAGKSFKCDERPPTGKEYGVVKVSAVTWGFYDESQTKTCLDPKRENDSLLIKEGDFLFSRANTIELIGACVIATKPNLKLMLSDKILRFHLKSIFPPYVLHYLRSKIGRSEIERLSTGNQESMRNIGQGRIESIQIPISPEVEQMEIVEQIESRLSEADNLDKTLDATLAQSESLRQSILKQAFEGKLVPQDPNDEPAEKLLERIRAERAASEEAPKKRGRYGGGVPAPTQSIAVRNGTPVEGGAPKPRRGRPPGKTLTATKKRRG